MKIVQNGARKTHLNPESKDDTNILQNILLCLLYLVKSWKQWWTSTRFWNAARPVSSQPSREMVRGHSRRAQNPTCIVIFYGLDLIFSVHDVISICLHIWSSPVRINKSMHLRLGKDEPTPLQRWWWWCSFNQVYLITWKLGIVREMPEEGISSAWNMFKPSFVFQICVQLNKSIYFSYKNLCWTYFCGCSSGHSIGPLGWLWCESMEILFQLGLPVDDVFTVRWKCFHSCHYVIPGDTLLKKAMERSEHLMQGGHINNKKKTKKNLMQGGHIWWIGAQCSFQLSDRVSNIRSTNRGQLIFPKVSRAQASSPSSSLSM